jgi:hypothetical protein
MMVNMIKSTALMNNVYYNLKKNKSQKFIKLAISLKEASNVILKYRDNNNFNGKHF